MGNVKGEVELTFELMVFEVGRVFSVVESGVLGFQLRLTFR